MRRYIQLFLVSMTCCTGTALAQGQGAAAYPAKPVRLMLGPGPGSVADGIVPQ